MYTQKAINLINNLQLEIKLIVFKYYEILAKYTIFRTFRNHTT